MHSLILKPVHGLQLLLTECCGPEVPFTTDEATPSESGGEQETTEKSSVNEGKDGDDEFPTADCQRKNVLKRKNK